MKQLLTKTSLLTCVTLSLIATGGAPGDPNSGSSGAYDFFSSTADKTSSLSGTAQQTNAKTGSFKLIESGGTIQHNTGATTIDDANYLFTDTDGPDDKNKLSDGKSTLSYKGNFPDTYKFVTTYDQSYKVDNEVYDLSGIMGISINAADMPTSNSATYAGDAEAALISSSGGFDLLNGKSSVTADFASSKVSVTLNGFSAFDQTTEKVTTAPIDEIKITDMVIAGNRFSGGTVVTQLAGVDVDIVGTNATSDAKGNFYGQNDTTKNPAELGGLLLIQGDSGLISATYLAK